LKLSKSIKKSGRPKATEDIVNLIINFLKW
jgi:hypothetical protein